MSVNLMAKPAESPLIFAGLYQLHGWQISKGRDNESIVSVTCPGCVNTYELDHEISNAGVITPSLDCPNPNCDFHETVQLVGWVLYGI